ncbi:MAG: DUF4118 domain-containing protein, partial [Gemmatimonadetes bacterium]|nr:DUF4118 domain-containing protein [Gemmatimonadota bacterium]
MPEQQIDSSRNDRARASPPAASPLRGYAVATLAAALALLFCVLLRPYLAPNYFLPFLGAVVVGAWYGGFGPGLLAGLLSVAASAYFFLAPIHSLRVDAGSDLFRLGIFATVAYLVSWANGRLRSTRAAAERRAEEASLMAAQLQEQA